MLFHQDCEPEPEATFELRVLHQAPQVFEIPNFISDAEADYIVAKAKPGVTRSTGNNSTTTSTSLVIIKRIASLLVLRLLFAISFA